ncbi:MAG TPA: cupin domain-containing protein [Blastococcus sp.]|jgi:hypothetical protein|nr:cupin domain-containing protein [Blastococcus sp.]
MLLSKNLDTPDDKRGFEHGEIGTVRLAGVDFSRAVLRPGWRWSQDVGPAAGLASCPATHLAVVVSGRLRVETEEGEAAELGPGDAHVVGAGHDAWVVGDQPCVTIDFEPTQAASRTAACPCGVSFRIDDDAALDHLVAAVQQHAAASHGHQPSREHILGELVSA